MEYKIVWVPLATETYLEEIDFIYLKWNQNEVDTFVLLVDENLKRLSINPYLDKIYKSVYKIIENEKRVELVYFWNNKKDSK